MYDDRTNLAQQVTENLREFFKDKLLKTVIPRNVRLAEAPSYGKPVLLYDPKSRGAESYARIDRRDIKASCRRKPQGKSTQGFGGEKRDQCEVLAVWIAMSKIRWML